MEYKKCDIINSQCPLCHGENAKVIQFFESKSVAQHLSLKVNDLKFEAIVKHVQTLWGANTCYFVTCLKCTFSYAVPYISGDSTFYKMIYDKESEYPQWKWEFQTTYDTILRIKEQKTLNNFKLLEIGAGMGNFVKKIASNLTNKENILTTEFSNYGENEINKFGIKCLSSDVWDIKLSEYKENFDFICMFQVLEHINNLEVLFNHISMLLKKGGSLFISVPSNFHRDFYEMHGIIEDVPPIHIGRWNKKCFNFLAKKHGYVVINYKIEPNKFSKNVVKFLNFKYKRYHFYRTVNNIKNNSLRKLFKITVLIPLILINIKLIKLFYNKDLGVSQWIHLGKK